MLLKPGNRVSLKEIDPEDSGPYQSREEVEPLLENYRQELAELQYLLYAESKHAVLIVLQGMDTSGKDGTIRHVMAGLGPIGVSVKAFKVPTEEELDHDFLWRVHQATPRKGSITIFNRSHYEDVLVVRVHDLVPRKVWKARYQQINDFERMLTRNDTVILKFFLHISKAEQKKRLEERLHDPKRHWKVSEGDIAERRQWSDYRRAYEDVLAECSTKWAPWHVVPANHKWYRNLVVAETIVQRLRELDMQFPPAKVDLSKIVVE